MQLRGLRLQIAAGGGGAGVGFEAELARAVGGELREPEAGEEPRELFAAQRDFPSAGDLARGDEVLRVGLDERFDVVAAHEREHGGVGFVAAGGRLLGFHGELDPVGGKLRAHRGNDRVELDEIDAAIGGDVQAEGAGRARGAERGVFFRVGEIDGPLELAALTRLDRVAFEIEGDALLIGQQRAALGGEAGDPHVER